MEKVQLELAALKHQTVYEAYRKETYKANEPSINGDGGAHHYATICLWKF